LNWQDNRAACGHSQVFGTCPAGNAEAIAALMNRSLQPKGITVVRAAFKDGCLQILLESAQVPNQQALVAFVNQGLTRLEAASIKQTYGRQTGEEFPA